VDRNGETPLLLATRAGSPELVSLLLDAGAPVDQANGSATTALMVAARAGSRELCERLLAAGAGTGVRDAGGLRAGDHAALASHLELAALLGVAARTAPGGPAPVALLHAGRTPLMVAAESGDIKVLRARIAARDALDAGDAQGTTALALASGGGSERGRP
jgi:ankyrin repeat protein